ncbi:hypothetical protein H4S07_003124, partial [Coemansia furcata]
MLATVAAKQLLTTVKAGAGRNGRATYQTYSPHGRGVPGDGKWPSRLLSYLRNAFSSASAKMSKHVLTANGPSNTAAGRLREAMPRGLGWTSRLVPRASCAAKSAMSRLGTNASLRSISQRLAAQLRVWPGASRFAGSRLGVKNWAFGSGGKWSPYLKIFARSMSGLSMMNNASPARVIMAQIQRQTMVGLMTQQRREFSMVSPLAYETRIRFLAPESTSATDHSSGRLAAGARVSSTCKRTAPVTAKKSPSEVALPLRYSDANSFHPAAKTSQDRASLADQCVTITIPYSAPVKNKPLGENGTSPNDVFKLLADADKLQRQHHLILSRLIERLSATGWDVYYQHVNEPAEGIEIALSPASGICTVVELESLLCSWGFDTLNFCATLREPRVLPVATTTMSDVPLSIAPTSVALDSDRSWNSESMDSNLFSLIIDEVVDPEEAYREEVCDFLNQLDRMPRLSFTCAKPGR